jgi:OOP family OmpA-OmpF porin
MEKKALRWLIALLFLAMATGCATKKAAYAPADVMSKAKAAGLVQCVDNFVVLFDKSDSMNPFYDPAGLSRLDYEKKTVSEMVQTIPADLKLNAALRLFGAERVGSDESTWLLYWMMPLKREEFQRTLDKIGKRGLGRTPIGRALAGAGGDLKGSSGTSAIILFSDFEALEGVDDIRPKSVMENVAKLKADYGDRVCIYPVQIGKDPVGKKLAEQIVADGQCGFVENADNLQTPDAMAAYVQKVFFCLPPPPPPVAEKPVVVPPPPPPPPEVTQLDSIYFDFDRYDLNTEAQETLKKNAAWLAKNPGKKVVVEVNCDDRGTDKYNMALGQKRAESAVKYLKSLGVSPERISTIIYGEERPLCKEESKECWSKNRRADFMIK